jgi:hypothetical protein
VPGAPTRRIVRAHGCCGCIVNERLADTAGCVGDARPCGQSAVDACGVSTTSREVLASSDLDRRAGMATSGLRTPSRALDAIYCNAWSALVSGLDGEVNAFGGCRGRGGRDAGKCSASPSPAAPHRPGEAGQGARPEVRARNKTPGGGRRPDHPDDQRAHPGGGDPRSRLHLPAGRRTAAPRYRQARIARSRSAWFCDSGWPSNSSALRSRYCTVFLWMMSRSPAAA